MEPINRQFGEVYVSAVVIGWPGRFGYYENRAENGDELHMDPPDFSSDFLHVPVARRG